MNIKKINDFVDIWASTINLTDEKIIQIIKEDIIKRCQMYGKVYQEINIQQDSCKAYIIKPVNGKYSLEDFFLNRLMLGIREVNLQNTHAGSSAAYTGDLKELSIDIPNYYKRINDKAKRHVGLRGKTEKIITKTIEHELGHCFKSSFSDGYLAPLGQGRDQDKKYEELIDNIKSFENGKYSDIIIDKKQLIKDTSKKIKTGVRDSQKLYGYYYGFELIDELLNETEALELTNSNDIHEIWPLQDKNGQDSPTGNYSNVYNYMSGYQAFTGYGPIIKSLLGRKRKSFYAEYISSSEIFKEFDTEFSDIFEDMYHVNTKDNPPMYLLSVLFNKLIENAYDEQIILELDEILGRCYEKKVSQYLEKSKDNISIKNCQSILEEINFFKTRMTTNNDEEKRNKLPHIVIFSQIEQKVNTIINNLSKNNNQPEFFLEKTQIDFSSMTNNQLYEYLVKFRNEIKNTNEKNVDYIIEIINEIQSEIDKRKAPEKNKTKYNSQNVQPIEKLPHSDEFIQGTNIYKPRNRDVYETEEEYIKYLEKYYGKYFKEASKKDTENHRDVVSDKKCIIFEEEGKIHVVGKDITQNDLSSLNSNLINNAKQNNIDIHNLEIGVHIIGNIIINMNNDGTISVNGEVDKIEFYNQEVLLLNPNNPFYKNDLKPIYSPKNQSPTYEEIKTKTEKVKPFTKELLNELEEEYNQSETVNQGRKR